MQNAGEHAVRDARHAVQEFSPWVAWIGRLGFAAIGVVYILIGILAVQGASSLRGSGSGSRSALTYIETLPYGQIMLAIVAVGLAFYALWRFTQAFMDTDAKGSAAKGIAIRFGFAAIGVFYLGLALSALGVSIGSGSGGEASAQSRTAWLLEQPFGPLLVAAAGAAIIGGGIYFFYKAWTAKFKKTLLLSQMSKSEEKWGTRFGRFGFTARGVVFCIIGTFLVLAALHSNPGETRDFAGALRVVESQAYGAYLLMLIAFGLFSYGVFMLFLAKHRRMVSTER
jgi:hypothetical protein